jgi:peptidoglycan/LPS O-acetylase OafA/YrhL
MSLVGAAGPVKSAAVPRDDRVLPATRTASLIVFAILVPALIVLWGTPGHTPDRWAWTIKPHLTAIFLGSGYGAGAFFFWRTYRARYWHPSSAGVLGASAFAALMLVATLLGWSKFNHGHAPFLGAFAFWGWTIVYIISPPAAFALWWRNRLTDVGKPVPRDVRVPALVLGAARVFAWVALVAAAVFFISPATAMHVWSWKLTPLTARVLASFTAQVGVGAMVLSFERRWSGWRLIVQTFFLATALLLIGALRESADFGPSAIRTALYIGGMLGADAALLALYVHMERGAVRGRRARR